MHDSITYRLMEAGEEDEVFNLVKTCFDEYVLHDVTEEGVKEFFRAAREMIYDHPAGHVILVAESAGSVAGMICIRDGSHVRLFFVARKFQQKGIGRGLLEQATAKCRADNPDISELTVNSSLYAAPIYMKLGFRKVKVEQLANGIRFIPMARPVENHDRKRK